MRDRLAMNPEKSVAPYLEHYLVILPEGYSPLLKYGAVYFLHGRNGNYKSLNDLGACAALESVVSKGANPFLIVAPDGQNGYWMNGAHNGQQWGD